MADDESENQKDGAAQLSAGTDYDIEALAKWKGISKAQALELINTSKEQVAELLKEYQSQKDSSDVAASPVHPGGPAANSNVPSGETPLS